MVLRPATWTRKRLTVDQSPRYEKAIQLFSTFLSVGWTSMSPIRKSAIGWPNGRPRHLGMRAESSPSMPRWFPRHRKALSRGEDDTRPRHNGKFSLIADGWTAQTE